MRERERERIFGRSRVSERQGSVVRGFFESGHLHIRIRGFEHRGQPLVRDGGRALALPDGN